MSGHRAIGELGWVGREGRAGGPEGTKVMDIGTGTGDAKGDDGGGME